MLAYAVETWRAIVALAERLGSIPDDLADVETLAQRLRDEAADAQAIVAMSSLICASTQI
jgi:hypothetical protein